MSGLNDITEHMNQLADLARASVLEYFRQPVDVISKDDASPVTIADRKTEQLLVDTISARFPDHLIFGEESGGSRDASGKLWVIDPIDGTKSFIIGRPTFGTLIAYIENHEPLAGVVEMPALDERWIGCAGQPTLHNGRAISASGCHRLESARLCTTSPDMFCEQEHAGFQRVAEHARFAVYGGDCYSYGLLASGHVDLVIEAGLSPYDYLALVAVIKGAGGVISDWQGQPLDMNSDGRVVAAATGALLDKTLGLLNA